MAQGVKIELTEQQLDWFKENFPRMTNADICAHLGFKDSHLHRLARKYGLKKSDEFLAWRDEKARKCHAVYYRLHPNQKGNAENIKQWRFKKGGNPKLTYGERFMEGIRKGQAKRRETVKVERARISFGLEQRTKLRLKRQPRKKILMRYYLRKKGYIVDDKNNIAYWTESTTRAHVLEARPKLYYSFQPYEKIS